MLDAFESKHEEDEYTDRQTDRRDQTHYIQVAFACGNNTPGLMAKFELNVMTLRAV